MLASQAQAPASSRTAARNLSDVDFTAFDFNLGLGQDTPLLFHQDTQRLGINVGSRSKRVRLGQPHDSRPNVRRKLNPITPIPFTPPCAHERLSTGYLTQGETNEDGFSEEQAKRLVPNVPIGFSDEDMHRSTSTNSTLDLSSDKGSDTTLDFLVLEDSHFTAKANVSRPKSDVTGTTSRRRPVPGENTPWLAASCRETTSSRGKDNPLNGQPHARSKKNQNQRPTRKVKEKPNTASTSNTPTSSAATNGWNLETGFDAIPVGPVSATEDNFKSHYVPTAHDVARDSRAEPDVSATSDNRFLRLLTPLNWACLDSTNIPTVAHLAPTTPNYPPANYGTTAGEIAHPNIPWNLFSTNSSELEALNWSNVLYAANTEMTPGFAEDFPDAPQTVIDVNSFYPSIWRQNMDLDFSANQRAFGFLEHYNNVDIDCTLQSLSDTNYAHIEQSKPLHSLGTYPKNWVASDQGGTLHYAQTGISTGTIPRIRSRQKKIYPTHAAVNRHPYRKPSSPSLLRHLSKLSTENSPSLLIDMAGQISTGLQSSHRMQDTLDFEEVVFSTTDSAPNSLSNSKVKNTITNNKDSQKHDIGDSIDSTRFQSDYRLSTRLENLDGNTKSHSPVLVLTENTNETQKDVQDLLAKANQHPRPEKTGDSSNSPLRNIATTWEHTFVVQNEFTDATTVPLPERTSRNLAKRRGPLGDDSKARAKEMRRIGSCFRCKIYKIACTPAEVCAACQKVPSPLGARICLRARLRDFVNLFLTEPAVRPFQKSSMDRLILEKVCGFSDNQFEIRVTSGPTYTPIQLSVHTFHTPDQSFLAFKKIVTNGSNVPTFISTYSPPLGIKDFSQDLKSKLISHISDITKRPRNYGEVLSGSMSSLNWDIYEAVRQYQARNPETQFLQNVLTIHAMQVFMTKSIAIIRESSEDVLKTLPRPRELDYSHNPNLRLINIQIKHLMYSLISDMYFSVLEQLEKELRPKEPALWAPNFCCIMILCMCAEMVQTTTDLRVVNALDDKAKSVSRLDKNGRSPSRDDSIDACRKLDDLPIATAIRSFHLVFGSKRGARFNPIRDGLDPVTKANLGHDVEVLVSQIHAVVKKYENELKDRASTPSFNNSSDSLEDHMVFRKRNSGRLVAGFLRSLL